MELDSDARPRMRNNSMRQAIDRSQPIAQSAKDLTY